MTTTLSSKSQKAAINASVDLMVKYANAKEVQPSLTTRDFLVQEAEKAGNTPLEAATVLLRMESGIEEFKKQYSALRKAPSATDYQLAAWRSLLQEKGLSPREQALFLAQNKQDCLALCKLALAEHLSGSENDTKLDYAITAAKAQSARFSQEEPSEDQITTLMEEFVEAASYIPMHISQSILNNVAQDKEDEQEEKAADRADREAALKSLNGQERLELGAYAVYDCARRGKLSEEELQAAVFKGNEALIGCCAAAVVEQIGIMQQMDNKEIDYETGAQALRTVRDACVGALIGVSIGLMITGSFLAGIGIIMGLLLVNSVLNKESVALKLNNMRWLQAVKNRFVIGTGSAINKTKEAISDISARIAAPVNTTTSASEPLTQQPQRANR